jgi:hypothetical protein
MSDLKKPEQSAAQTTQDIVKQVAEAMMGIIPAAVATAVQAANSQRQAAAPQAPAQVRPAARCSDCGQAVSACHGKHVQMVVYPTRYPEHAEYFQGVLLNGVKYLSNNEGHQITVPEVAFSDIKSIVAGFEQNEQDMKLGRKVERHSGTVSPHGVSFNPANQAWR